MPPLRNLALKPPFQGTSRQLDWFEAYQESFEQRVNAQALADILSMSTEHPQPYAIPPLILQMYSPPVPQTNVGALAGTPSSSVQQPQPFAVPAVPPLIFQMYAAPAPQANVGALAGMPSSSSQQPQLPETPAAKRQVAPQGASRGSGAGFMPLPAKKPHERLNIQILRALHDALTRDPDLDLTAWAQAHHLCAGTIKGYVSRGALTPEAQDRLDVANGKTSSLRRMSVDDLRALDAMLADGHNLSVSRWARARGLNANSARTFVRNGALTPAARRKLQNAEGGQPTEPWNAPMPFVKRRTGG
ncbi:hypothetical protein [Pandoraea pulmonicola]|nr:hypothetical protein [Pandoraea pulmonicola]